MVRKIKRREGGEKPASLDELDAQVQAGLATMAMEQTDAIIGQPEDAYNLLGKTVAPLHRMLILLAYNNGLRENTRVKKA